MQQDPKNKKLQQDKKMQQDPKREKMQQYP